MHEQARTRPQDLSLPVAPTAVTPAEPGVGDRYHLHPDGAGFVYLAVLLDWFSRRVPAWRLSITMEAAFFVDTLEDALAGYGKLNIFSTDPGSQFTGKPSPRAYLQRHCNQHGGRRRLASQRVLSIGCGAASNSRRRTASPRQRQRPPRLTRPPSGTLTVSYPIKPTSTNCPSAWQPNPGRDSTYRNGKSVQTTSYLANSSREIP
jgi:putative transposase